MLVVDLNSIKCISFISESRLIYLKEKKNVANIFSLFQEINVDGMNLWISSSFNVIFIKR